MHLCPNFWNKEGLNEWTKIEVCKHSLLGFMFVLHSMTIKGVILETCQVSHVPGVSHVLILVDFLL